MVTSFAGMAQEATDTVSAILTVAPDSIAGAVADSIVTPRRTPRKITPVDVDDNKPTVVMHYYDKHGEPLEEPVMFLATLDTVTKVKSKPIYPLYNGVCIGVNFADAILMAAGQKHASFDLWADVSLHNWFFPVIEAGIGFADNSPKNSNFKYKGKPSFYTKIGINYNFLYKSNPDYQCFLGLRGGFSSFGYDVDNINISNGYWGEDQVINLRGLRATALYGEVLAGIKVKIYRRFSMGWSIRYHFKFRESTNSASGVWFIPGYGTNSPISFSLSAIYTIPGPKTAEIKKEQEKAKD